MTQRSNVNKAGPPRRLSVNITQSPGFPALRALLQSSHLARFFLMLTPSGFFFFFFFKPVCNTSSGTSTRRAVPRALEGMHVRVGAGGPTAWLPRGAPLDSGVSTKTRHMLTFLLFFEPAQLLSGHLLMWPNYVPSPLSGNLQQVCGP